MGTPWKPLIALVGCLLLFCISLPSRPIHKFTFPHKIFSLPSTSLWPFPTRHTQTLVPTLYNLMSTQGAVAGGSDGPPGVVSGTGGLITPVVSTFPVAIVTGGAGTLGSRITTALHSAGYAVVVHYASNSKRAVILVKQLNAIRPTSAIMVQSNFEAMPQTAAEVLVDATLKAFGRIDVIVNNAGLFEPTDLLTVTMEDWTRHLNLNGAAALFLAQKALPHLEQHRGVIINICDIHGERPLLGHSVYSVSKAALIMLTKALAKDLGIRGVRVNGVSPGAISWIAGKHDDPIKQDILNRTALKALGSPANIAEAVLFMVRNDYVTGQVISVDGGRTLNQ